QFNQPWTAAIDEEGRVYVVDGANARIQVFEADGTFIREWGTRGSEPGQLRDPFGIAIAPDGTFLVTNVGGDIWRYDADGAFLGPYTVTADEVPRPRAPFGILIDAAGNVYLQDYS